MHLTDTHVKHTHTDALIFTYIKNHKDKTKKILFDK